MAEITTYLIIVAVLAALMIVVFMLAATGNLSKIGFFKTLMPQPERIPLEKDELELTPTNPVYIPKVDLPTYNFRGEVHYLHPTTDGKVALFQRGDTQPQLKAIVNRHDINIDWVESFINGVPNIYYEEGDTYKKQLIKEINWYKARLAKADSIIRNYQQKEGDRSMILSTEQRENRKAMGVSTSWQYFKPDDKKTKSSEEVE